MDIFNTPDWESSKIGDNNAIQLCRTNAETTIIGKSRAKKLNRVERRSNIKAKKVRRLKNYEISIGDTFGSNLFGNKRTEKPIISTKIIQNCAKKNKNNELVWNVERKLKKQKTIKVQKKNKIIYKQINICEYGDEKINHHNYKDNLSHQKKVTMKNNLNTLETANKKCSSKIQAKKAKLINLLNSTPILSQKKKNTMSLKERMLEKLKASRFRYINEQIYNSESKEAQYFFKKDPDAFHAYHEGYRQQVLKWPLNPLVVIIKDIKKMPADYVIADFGCGDATLAKSVSQKVYSFDLVAVNEFVTACDMSRVPLENDSVDVVVFCLSLMGTNIREYLFEANRVLKNGGLLKIAEVESRFDTVDVFIEGVKRFGFINTWKDLSHNLFYFLNFKKTSKCKSINKLPTISLYPCLYKKR